MTQPLENQPTAESTQAAKSMPSSPPADPAINIPPKLAAYFGPQKFSGQAFSRALKLAKIKRFDSSDEAAAMELMPVSAPEGDRLWALMSLSPMPDAVELWVWRAAIDRLKTIVGDDVDPFTTPPAEVFGRFRVALKARSNPKKGKSDKIAGENWLRILSCWLMERRAADPWQMAEQAAEALFSTRKEAVNYAIKLIRRGRPSDFRITASIAGLGVEAVATALKERDDKRIDAAVAQASLKDALDLVDQLRGELLEVQKERDRAAEAHANATVMLESERQHFGHDLSGTKAEQRVLLQRRLVPLLSDAIDALEIEPPAQDIALERIKTVLLHVNEASRD